MPALWATTVKTLAAAGDVSHDQVMLALIAVIATGFATLGVVIRALLARQEQRVIGQVTATKEGVSRIEDVVNHVDEDVRTPNGKPNLGRMVRDLVDRVEEGFTENRDSHQAILGIVSQVSHRVDDNTRRLDRLEDQT